MNIHEFKAHLIRETKIKMTIRMMLMPVYADRDPEFIITGYGFRNDYITVGVQVYREEDNTSFIESARLSLKPFLNVWGFTTDEEAIAEYQSLMGVLL